MRPENYKPVKHPPSEEYELYFGPNHPGIEGNYALKIRLSGDEVQSVRAELIQSIRILRQIIARLPSVKGPIRAPLPNPLAWNLPHGDAYTRTESSKGELGFFVVSNGGTRPWRVHVRGPSQMHAVQVLEKMTVGQRLEDVAQIMFTLDACPPEVDR